jgi:tetratricopeptide (TPR) repeat protein
MMRRRRTLILGCLLLAGVTAAGVLLWRAWERHDLERRVERSLEALRSQGSLDTVKDTLARLAGRNDWQAEQHLLQGALLLRSGQPDPAMKQFRFVPHEGKLRIPLYLLVGEALFLRGELVAAEETFRTMTREHPDDADAHLWLAKVYHEFGSAKALTGELEHVERLRPDDFRAYWLLGSMYADDLQQFEAGAKKFRQALERNPPERQRADIIRGLLRCLLLLKSYADVLEVAQQLPDSSFKQVVMAEGYRGVGDDLAAQRLIDRLDETDPELEGVLLLGAVLAIERKEAQVAVPRLKKLLDRDPYNTVVRHQLSLAYQSLGDTAASKAESQRMQEIRDLQLRREQLYTRAIGQPADAGVRDELASVCEQLGRNDEAARWRRNAAQTRMAVRAQHGSP